jgi:hypothetical protein
MPNWLRNQLIAVVACLVIAVVVHEVSCLAATSEACRISRGLLWLYWAAAYLFVGGPIAMASRGNASPRASDEDSPS